MYFMFVSTSFISGCGFSIFRELWKQKYHCKLFQTLNKMFFFWPGALEAKFRGIVPML